MQTPATIAPSIKINKFFISLLSTALPASSSMGRQSYFDKTNLSGKSNDLSLPAVCIIIPVKIRKEYIMLRKIITYLLIFVLMTSFLYVENSLYSAQKKVKTYGYSSSKLDLSRVKNSEYLLRRTRTVLPPAYTGTYTAIKNQGAYGSCSQFAALASAESGILKNSGTVVDMSEKHLGFAKYNEESIDTDYPLDAGGNIALELMALSKYYGAVDEAMYPFPKDDEWEHDSYESLEKVDIKKVQYALSNMYILPTPYNSRGGLSVSNLNKIKEAIYTYGNVYAGFFAGDTADHSDGFEPVNNGGPYAFYNRSYSLESDGPANHAITIVGYDDNFSRNNFKNKPLTNGAFLCKNSWGKSWGNNGLFWMSYAERSIDEIAFFDMTGSIYDEVYFHDDLGYQGLIRDESQDNDLPVNQAISEAEVFKIEDSMNGQILEAVSFFSMAPGVEYEISIYKGSDLNANPTDGTLVGATAGVLDLAGYYTKRLDTQLTLDSADRYYSVVIELGGVNEVSVEKAYTNNDYMNIEEGESFIKFRDETTWNELTNYYLENGAGAYGNLDIKAFTNGCKRATNISLVGSSSWNYSLGQEFNFGKMKMDVTYEDATVQRLSLRKAIVSGIKTNVVGNHPVTISYKHATRTLTLSVKKSTNCNLYSINFVGFKLSPSFSRSKTKYTVKLKKTTKIVKFYMYPDNDFAKIYVKTGTKYKLHNWENIFAIERYNMGKLKKKKIYIKCVAQSGASKIYTVTLVKK